MKNYFSRYISVYVHIIMKYFLVKFEVVKCRSSICPFRMEQTTRYSKAPI